MRAISPQRKTAIVLFNLGGPDAPEAVRPFLFNLFSDPAIDPISGIEGVVNTYIVSLGLIGFIGLCVSWFPAIVARLQISYSIVFVGLGFFLYSITDILPLPSPYRDEHLTVRLTELIVIIALMGTGLKIDRAFGLRKWHVPFRLLIVAMILSIASLTFLGAWLLGLQLASALLLAAALAPTDRSGLAGCARPANPQRLPRWQSVGLAGGNGAEGQQKRKPAHGGGIHRACRGAKARSAFRRGAFLRRLQSQP